MKPSPTCWFGSLMAAYLSIVEPAQAQIIPDATLPNNSQVTPGCVVCAIEGGTVRGTNLFHSFQEFSVPTGGAAWFNNAPQIQNILTRVTGSSISTIDGLIRANGTANLFLLNPNGIIFGPNAQLNVGGSFVATTASSFRFPDGSEFSATNPQAPPLLAVNVPIGLQYGKGQAPISNAGNLSVKAGESLTLFGNTVTVSGTLTAPGGIVELLGDRVGLFDNAQVDVSSDIGGGTVRIGGNFQGRGPLPNATNTFVGPNVRITADAFTRGDGGSVIVWADETTRFYGSVSARGGIQSGNGGLIEISGKQTLDFNGRVDTQAPKGLTGNLLLDPTNIEIVPFALNFDLTTVDQFTDADLAVGNTRISAFAIDNAIANVALQATNNIIFRTDVTLQPDIEFTAEAGNDILIDSFTLSTLGGKLVLSAGRNISVINPDQLGFRINSGGGDLALKAGGDVIVRNAAVDTLDRVGSGGSRSPGNMTVEAERLVLQNNGQLGTLILDSLPL